LNEVRKKRNNIEIDPTLFDQLYQVTDDYLQNREESIEDRPF